MANSSKYFLWIRLTEENLNKIVEKYNLKILS